MEDQAAELEKKLAKLLLETAEASVALDRLNGKIQGIPHYSVIELRAHEIGRQLSCRIQEQHLASIMSHQVRRMPCPKCGTETELIPVKRTVSSIDGKLDTPELEGYCRHCRRAFFPPPDSPRL